MKVIFLSVLLLLHCSAIYSFILNSHPSYVNTLSSISFDQACDRRYHNTCFRGEQHRHYFQQKDKSDGGDGGDNKTPFLSRFVPGIFKKKAEKPKTETDTSMRYELRLKNVNAENRRHVTTRLQRYLPDLQFETAQDIVDVAIESELG